MTEDNSSFWTLPNKVQSSDEKKEDSSLTTATQICIPEQSSQLGYPQRELCKNQERLPTIGTNHGH